MSDPTSNPITHRARAVCWALARECRDDDVLVVGVATPLAAAAAMLARELVAPDLTVIVGGAVDPPTMDVAVLLSDPPAVCSAAPAVLGQRDLLTLLHGGAMTLQFVSPAQVGADGAVNTSRVRTATGGWRPLPGCLALPDTTALVGRLVAYRVEGGPRFAVDHVDYVTGVGTDPAVRGRWALPGRGVVAVVTGDGRRSTGSAAWEPLESTPADADVLLDRVIDPHGVIELETRHGRHAARQRLARISSP